MMMMVVVVVVVVVDVVGGEVVVLVGEDEVGVEDGEVGGLGGRTATAAVIAVLTCRWNPPTPLCPSCQMQLPAHSLLGAVTCPAFPTLPPLEFQIYFPTLRPFSRPPIIGSQRTSCLQTDVSNYTLASSSATLITLLRYRLHGQNCLRR